MPRWYSGDSRTSRKVHQQHSSSQMLLKHIPVPYSPRDRGVTVENKSTETCSQGWCRRATAALGKAVGCWASTHVKAVQHSRCSAKAILTVVSSNAPVCVDAVAATGLWHRGQTGVRESRGAIGDATRQTRRHDARAILTHGKRAPNHCR